MLHIVNETYVKIYNAFEAVWLSNNFATPKQLKGHQQNFKNTNMLQVPQTK